MNECLHCARNNPDSFYCNYYKNRGMEEGTKMILKSFYMFRYRRGCRIFINVIEYAMKHKYDNGVYIMDYCVDVTKD